MDADFNLTLHHIAVNFAGLRLEALAINRRGPL